MHPPSQPSWRLAATLGILALASLPACSNAESGFGVGEGDGAATSGPTGDPGPTGTGGEDPNETDGGETGETDDPEDPPGLGIDPPAPLSICDGDTGHQLTLDLVDANAESTPVLVAEQVLHGDGKVPGIPLSPRAFLSHYGFDYAPADGELLEISGELWDAPMVNVEAPNRYGLQYAVRAPAWPEQQRPPIDLVVVVDLSAAMGGDPLALAGVGIEAIESALVPGDRVTLIGAAEAPYLLAATDDMGIGPSDLADYVDEPKLAPMADLDAALELAYATLHAPSDFEGQPRVLLISNGHYQWSDELPELVADEAAEGVYLSALGVGDPSQHDELTLGALVQPGQGSSLFAATDEQIWDALDFALPEHLMSAALELELELELPAGLALRERPNQPIENQPTPRRAQLGPGEALVFHYELEACAELDPDATIGVEISWVDPFSGEAFELAWDRPVAELEPPSARARKGAATVAYARALQSYRDLDDPDAAYGAILDAITRITAALEAAPMDPDLVEMSAVVATLGQ